MVIFVLVSTFDLVFRSKDSQNYRFLHMNQVKDCLRFPMIPKQEIYLENWLNYDFLTKVSMLLHGFLKCVLNTLMENSSGHGCLNWKLNNFFAEYSTTDNP